MKIKRILYSKTSNRICRPLWPF